MNRPEHIGRVDHGLRAGSIMTEDHQVGGEPITRGMLATAIAREAQTFLVGVSSIILPGFRFILQN